MFGATGSPDQFEKFIEKQLKLHKTLTKSMKNLWIGLKNGKRILQLSLRQSEVSRAHQVVQTN